MLHIEASTYCNARCPQCPRNLCGMNIDLPTNNKHIDIKKLKNLLGNNTHELYFCGNYGDPMMHPGIVELCSLGASTISTNGSIGRITDYISLAKQGTTIIFCIDGLEDTNHIYRQDVSWDSLIKRVNVFIEAGGNAVWKFIKFKHNIHQLEQARLKSQMMGFSNFLEMDDSRDYGPILDNHGNEVNWLFSYKDDNMEKYKFDVEFEKEILSNPVPLIDKTDYSAYNISCEAKRNNSLYIDVDCNILPCCYFGIDRKDHNMYKRNTFKETQQLLKNIENNWKTSSCHSTCAESCGWQ